jgi:hypothetical protein
VAEKQNGMVTSSADDATNGDTEQLLGQRCSSDEVSLRES